MGEKQVDKASDKQGQQDHLQGAGAKSKTAKAFP